MVSIAKMSIGRVAVASITLGLSGALAAAGWWWSATLKEGSATTVDEQRTDHVLQAASSATLSDYQKAVQADDVVTFSEYRSAFGSLAQCIINAGARFESEPVLTSANIYDFIIVLDVGADDAARPRVDNCITTYWTAVPQTWASANLPPRDTVAAAMREVAACMRERGFDVPADPPAGWANRYWGTEDSFPLDEGIAYRDCATAVYNELGFPRGHVPIP